MIQTFLATATPVGPDATSDSMFNLDPFTVSIILGFIIPIVNGILTKASTPAWVKGVVTLFLSAVSGLLTVGLTDNGGAVFSQATLKSAVLAFGIAVASYYSVWRPFGLTSTPTPGGEAKLAPIGIHDPAAA
jgi:hypothetical protein